MPGVQCTRVFHLRCFSVYAAPCRKTRVYNGKVPASYAIPCNIGVLFLLRPKENPSVVLTMCYVLLRTILVDLFKFMQMYLHND